MGCVSGVLVGALLLAIPASLARASLVGAYVMLAVVVGLIVLAVTRRRPADPSRTHARLRVLAGVTVVYAAAVAVIHYA